MSSVNTRRAELESFIKTCEIVTIFCHPLCVAEGAAVRCQCRRDGREIFLVRMPARHRSGIDGTSHVLIGWRVKLLLAAPLVKAHLVFVPLEAEELGAAAAFLLHIGDEVFVTRFEPGKAV